MGFGGWIGQASQAGPASSPQWTTPHRFVDQDKKGGDDGGQRGAHTSSFFFRSIKVVAVDIFL